MRPFRSGILLLALAASSGCTVELLHDIDESEANEILDALQRDGIGAKKHRVTQGNKPTYMLEVRRADAPQAWRILRQQSLPQPKRSGLGEVFGKVGLVPTATQERAMLRHALSGELSRTLQSVEGVREARVHVVLPERDPLAPLDAAAPRPRASVLLKVAGTAPLTEPQVRQLVAGAVDGLDAASVSVVIVRGQPAPSRAAEVAALASVGPFVVDASSRATLLVTLVGMVLALLTLGLGLLFALRRQRSLRLALVDAQAAPTGLAAVDLDSSLALLNRSLQVSRPGGSRTGNRLS
ncbi:MAG: secretion protein [Deltaproteobacteria bacterium]|nr:secretion protein [Deltaproteobacteria bacterium]